MWSCEFHWHKAETSCFTHACYQPLDRESFGGGKQVWRPRKEKIMAYVVGTFLEQPSWIKGWKLSEKWLISIWTMKLENKVGFSRKGWISSHIHHSPATFQVPDKSGQVAKPADDQKKQPCTMQMTLSANLLCRPFSPSLIFKKVPYAPSPGAQLVVMDYWRSEQR